MLLHGRGADEHDLYPAPRRARSRAAPARDHAARPARAAAGRRPLVPARRHPDPRSGDVLAELQAPWRRCSTALPVPTRPRRARRLLAGGGDELGARARRRPAAAGRDHGALGLHAGGRGLRARPGRARRAIRSPSRTARSTPSSRSSSAARRPSACAPQEPTSSGARRRCRTRSTPGVLPELQAFVAAATG